MNYKISIKISTSGLQILESTNNFTFQFHRPLRSKLKTFYVERQMENREREREREEKLTESAAHVLNKSVPLRNCFHL
jgi:hypothetical protein